MNCLTKTEKMKSDIFIPKFEIKMKKNLLNIFKQCGLKTIFEKSEANLKSISFEDLWVSDIVHSSNVSVTEKGVTAAAATFIACNSNKKIQNFTFRIDRSFLFIIVDSLKKIPIFMNAIFDPNQN